MTSFRRVITQKALELNITSVAFGRSFQDRANYTNDDIGRPVKLIDEIRAVHCSPDEAQAVVYSVESYTVNDGYAFGAILWLPGWSLAKAMLPFDGKVCRQP